jgi:hypothetical protein
MPLNLNTHKLPLTRNWKHFKLLSIPVNSAVAIINTFLLYNFPGLSTAIPQASVYLKTISAIRVINRSRINQPLFKTIHSNYMNVLFVALLTVCIVSCQSHAGTGIKKDLAKGSKTEHRNMEPASEGSRLVVNDLLLRVISIPN